jgi:cell fate regulator YaaT (PSP1 superfamily)
LVHALVRYGRLRHLAEFVPVGERPAARRPCVITTPRGVELGQVLAVVDQEELPTEAGLLLRMATPRDEAEGRELAAQAEQERARVATLAEATAPGLRVIAAERLLSGLRPDEPKLVVYYASATRIDMPAVLREAHAALGVEVELVQVGARARARACGGAGVCGRTLCCSTFLRALEPVTMRMAQVQGLTTSPETTAGACGRLKCCLRYENPLYEESRRGLPRAGWIATARRARGTVVAVDVLRRRVLVRPLEEGAAPVTLFADEVLSVAPPPRTPLPQAGAPPAKPPASEGPPSAERGWSDLARRLWRRMGSGRNPKQPGDEPPPPA